MGSIWRIGVAVPNCKRAGRNSSSSSSAARPPCRPGWRSPFFGLARHAPVDESVPTMDTVADRLPTRYCLRGGTGDVDFAATFVRRFQRVVFGIAMTVADDLGTRRMSRSRPSSGRAARSGVRLRCGRSAWMKTIDRNLALTSSTLSLRAGGPGRSVRADPATTDSPAQFAGAHQGRPCCAARSPAWRRHRRVPWRWLAFTHDGPADRRSREHPPTHGEEAR